MKIKREFVVGPEVQRGIVKLAYPFSREINDRLKKLPGVHPVWAGEHTSDTGKSKFEYWAGPIEFQKEYHEIANQYRLSYCDENLERVVQAPPEFRESLLSHQVEACLRILDERSHLVSFETGGGKTRVGLEILRLTLPESAIIICPASAKQVWKREIQRWEPELLERFGFVEPGQEIPDAPWLVVNFELVHKVDVAPWDVVIVDELHNIANGGKSGSRRAKIVSEIAALNAGAYRIGLTATPIMTDPKQFFWQGNFLFPRRYGVFGQFMKRYSGKTPCAYADSGFKYAGLDPEHKEEFHRRVGAVSTRATTEDYGQHMPSNRIETLEFKPPARFNPEKAVQNLLAGNGTLDDVVRHHTQVKLKFASEQIAEASKLTSHVIAFTHYRDSAEQLCNALRGKLKGVEPVLINGSIPTKRRAAILDEQKMLETSIVVATMHSVKEAIDLTKYSRSFLVELYWSPGIMTQVLGRLHRLNSVEQSHTTILVVKGSGEENVAAILDQRYADQRSLQRPTTTEGALSSALTTKRSDEELADYLGSLTAGLELRDFDTFGGE